MSYFLTQSEAPTFDPKYAYSSLPSHQNYFYPPIQNIQPQNFIPYSTTTEKLNFPYYTEPQNLINNTSAYQSTDASVMGDTQPYPITNNNIGPNPFYNATNANLNNNFQRRQSLTGANYSSHPTSLESLPDAPAPNFEYFKDPNILNQKQYLVEDFLSFGGELNYDNQLTNKLEYTNAQQTVQKNFEPEFESDYTMKSNTSNASPYRSNPSDMDNQFAKSETPISGRGWNEEDEALLKQLAIQYKYDWKKVAKKFNNKKYTPHFLKMKYKGTEDANQLKRIKFTHEEDVLIAKCFDEYGIEWEKMVPFLPNRTAVMIKNRYYSYIRKHKRLENLLEEAKGENQAEIKIHIEAPKGQNIYFGTSGQEQSPDNNVNNVTNEEVIRLRAQLKSLKSLYLVTFRELSKFKAQ